MAVVLLFAFLWAMVARASGAGECNQPPKLENGALGDEYLGKDTFASGSRVSYVCNPGYTFAEYSRRSVTCNEGVWEPLQATCTLKTCGSPGEILNGYYRGDNTFGSQVTFYCNEGYTLVGRNYRMCEVDGWSGQVPTCEAVKCPDIPTIENGRVSRPSTESWEYGMVAEVSCLGDYSLIGERKLTCESSGRWNHPFPKCKDVKCPAPDFPETVHITSIYKPIYKYQEEIIFRCKEGYEMKGDRRIVCGEDGNFSPPPPTCTPHVGCRAPDIPENVRMVSIYKPTYKYQEEISFQCEDGYEMEGHSRIVCGKDGNFSPPPPTCTPHVKCPLPDFPDNVEMVSTHKHTYKYQEQISFRCKEGFELNGNSVIVCEEGGNFSPPPPTCTKPEVFPSAISKVTTTTATDVKCPLPDFPDNVEMVSTHKHTYKYQEQISFRCKKGFELNGNSVIVCEEGGNFSSPPPTCTKHHKGIPQYQKILYGVLGVVAFVIILLMIVFLYKRYCSHGSGSVLSSLTKNKKRDTESGEAHSNQMKPLAAAEGAK